MKILRRKTRIVKIGNVFIGGNHPVAIQSMTKVRTADVPRVVREIKVLENAGCEIVRVAVKDKTDALAIKRIKDQVKLPIVADIHFDWRLSLAAIESGADKIRLNPGNISKRPDIERVVSALKIAKKPLRIGLNSGSVEGVFAGRKMSVPDKLVKACLGYLKIIEKLKYRDIVISVKASNVLDTVEAYRKISKVCDYPLHLGVTATGLPYAGAIKSSIALGALLMDGIGDTIRISLTDKPVEEVNAAKIILESLGLRRFGHEIISCPTCGRCEVDLVRIVKELENRILGYPGTRIPGKFLKIAVMGCVVNGPGEAKEADIGVAFGKKEGLLFKKGKTIRKIPVSNCVDILLKEMKG